MQVHCSIYKALNRGMITTLRLESNWKIAFIVFLVFSTFSGPSVTQLTTVSKLRLSEKRLSSCQYTRSDGIAMTMMGSWCTYLTLRSNCHNDKSPTMCNVHSSGRKSFGTCGGSSPHQSGMSARVCCLRTERYMDQVLLAGLRV